MTPRSALRWLAGPYPLLGGGAVVIFAGALLALGVALVFFGSSTPRSAEAQVQPQSTSLWFSITDRPGYLRVNAYCDRSGGTVTVSGTLSGTFNLSGYHGQKDFALTNGTYSGQIRLACSPYTDTVSNYSFTYPPPTPTPTSTPTHSVINLTTATLSIDSEGANTLSLTWPAQSNLPATTDWYYYLREGSATGNTIASGKFADDSPNLTSAAISLTRRLTPGGTYYVRILPYSNTPWNNQGFRQVTTTTGSACADTDAVDLGNLTGFSTDQIGNFQTTDCTIGGKAADVYKFQLSTARDTGFGLTPLVSFDSVGYSSGYSLRVRQINLAGESKGHATGLGNLDIDDIAIGAGQTYVVVVQRSGIGGGYGYSLNIAYGYVQPPTPTPLPSATPRAQPNLDFRLVPDPEGFYYRLGQKYSFSPEGPEGKYPLTVRSGNPAAFALAANIGIDCPAAGNPPASVQLQNHNDTLHLTACAAGKNSTLTALDPSGQLLAQYSLYIGGGAAATPGPGAGGPLTGSGGGPPPPGSGDLLGLSVIVGYVCEGAGVACDTGMVVNLLAVLLVVGLMLLLLSRRRGPVTYPAVGVAAAFGVMALMLSSLWLGFPLWVSGLVLTAMLAAGAVMFVQKGRQAG